MLASSLISVQIWNEAISVIRVFEHSKSIITNNYSYYSYHYHYNYFYSYIILILFINILFIIIFTIIIIIIIIITIIITVIIIIFIIIIIIIIVIIIIIITITINIIPIYKTEHHYLDIPSLYIAQYTNMAACHSKSNCASKAAAYPVHYLINAKLTWFKVSNLKGKSSHVTAVDVPCVPWLLDLPVWRDNQCPPSLYRSAHRWCRSSWSQPSLSPACPISPPKCKQHVRKLPVTWG